MVIVRAICIDEAAIMLVAKGDAESSDKAEAAFQSMMRERRCGPLPGSVLARVVEKIGVYKDYEGASTDILKVQAGESSKPAFVLTLSQAAKNQGYQRGPGGVRRIEVAHLPREAGATYLAPWICTTEGSVMDMARADVAGRSLAVIRNIFNAYRKLGECFNLRAPVTLMRLIWEFDGKTTGPGQVWEVRAGNNLGYLAVGTGH